jgi:flagellar export protein FliJ
MKPFRFRFESVLKARRHEEELVIRGMAPFVAELGKIQSMVESAREAVSQWNRDKARWLSDASSISLYSSALSTYRANLTRLESERQKAETAMAPWREKLSEAMRKRKALEVLRDRDRAVWHQENKKRERIQVEELVAVRRAIAKNELAMLL